MVAYHSPASCPQCREEEAKARALILAIPHRGIHAHRRRGIDVLPAPAWDRLANTHLVRDQTGRVGLLDLVAATFVATVIGLCTWGNHTPAPATTVATVEPSTAPTIAIPQATPSTMPAASIPPAPSHGERDLATASDG